MLPRVRPVLVAACVAATAVLCLAYFESTRLEQRQVEPPQPSELVDSDPDFLAENLPHFRRIGTGAEVRYGRGISIVDIDGDGRDDIFVCDSANTLTEGHSMAYRNEGGGRFTSWDVLKGVDTRGNWGAVWFDMDGDGDQDLVLARGGYEAGTHATPLVLRNDVSRAGTVSLVDVSAAALGLTSATNRLRADSLEQLWWGVSAADMDNDGRLDFAITNGGQSMHFDVWRNNEISKPGQYVITNVLYSTWV